MELKDWRETLETVIPCRKIKAVYAEKRFPIKFITGNKKKLEEFRSIVVGSPLE